LEPRPLAMRPADHRAVDAVADQRTQRPAKRPAHGRAERGENESSHGGLPWLGETGNENRQFVILTEGQDSLPSSAMLRTEHVETLGTRHHCGCVALAGARFRWVCDSG